MAHQFSHVRVSTPDGNEAEFLVSGIPREFDDFEYYTTFEDFLAHIPKRSERVLQTLQAVENDIPRMLFCRSLII